MPPKKTGTKKAPATTARPPKVGPPEVTPAKVREWRENIKRLSRRVEDYDLDLDEISKMLRQIEAGIPDPPPIIEDAEKCRLHQRHLRKLCHLRTKCSLIQGRCIQAKTLWGHIIKIARGHLWGQPELMSLKNDTQRGDVLRRVVGNLELKYARVSSYIDHASAIIWTLKDNQRAVLGMIQAASEERFLFQAGMEK